MQHDIYAKLPRVPILCALQGATVFVLPALFLFTFGIYVHLGAVTEWIQWTAYIWPTGLLFIGMYFTVPNRANRLRSSIAIAVYGTLIWPFLFLGLRFSPLWLLVVICLIIGLLIASYYRKIVYFTVILTVSFAAILIAFNAIVASFTALDLSVARYRYGLKEAATLILLIWAVTGAIVGTLLSRVQNEEVVLQEELAKAD